MEDENEIEEVIEKNESTVSLLTLETKVEPVEVEDNIDAVIDHTPRKEISYKELPPVEEDIALAAIVKDEEREEELTTKEETAVTEIHEEEALPIEAADEETAFGDHNSTTIRSTHDPFLLVGKKLPSTNDSASSTWKNDSLQFSLSTRGTLNTQTNPQPVPTPAIIADEEDSLFHDVDNDMSLLTASPEKKENNRSSSPQQQLPPTDLDEDTDRIPPVVRLDQIRSLSQNIVEETIAVAQKTSPRADSDIIPAVSNIKKKSPRFPKEQPKTVENGSEEMKNDRQSERAEVKQDANEDNEKGNSTFRNKKGLPKTNPASSHHKASDSELSTEEMVRQAENQALKQKKEKEEKLQLKKFKKNIEKLKEREDVKQETDLADGKQSKHLLRQKEEAKDKSETENNLDKPTKSHRRHSKEKAEIKPTKVTADVDTDRDDHQKHTNRRISKEKADGDDGGEHPHRKQNSTDTETEKDPKAVRSNLKKKVPTTKKDEKLLEAANLKEGDHQFSEISSSRRNLEKEEKDDANSINTNPTKRKVHPSKFPAIIRNQVKLSKQNLDFETSADDSSINIEKREKVKVPFSSPSDRGPQSENNSESANKPKKKKPLYLRLQAKAIRLKMEEEKKKHDAYVQMRNKRYKQPTREEIRDHMKQFDELLKLKSEEFKQNHISQMRELKKQRQKSLSVNEGGADDSSVLSQQSRSIANNNPWDDNNDALLTPKKPEKGKKDQSKHHHPHRSLVDKDGNDEEENERANGEEDDLLLLFGGKENNQEQNEFNQNASSIQQYLATTTDNASDNSLFNPLKSPNELVAESSFLPITTPSPMSNISSNAPLTVNEPFSSPRPLTPGTDLPLEEIASLLERDWIGRMKE